MNPKPLWLRVFCKRLAGFGRAEGAVAAVEFALILPLMLFLYIGSTELSQLITVDRRVTTASGTIGDLVSRANLTLTQAELDDYFVAAERILRPFDSAALKQTVTCVSVDAQGAVTVVWSKAHNGAEPHVAGAAYVLPPEMIAISKGLNVIVSEAAYSHTPLLGIVFKTAMPFYRESFYLPRFGGTISIL